MIIFPHVPKTAGSSVRIALQDHFKDRMYLDYSAPPASYNPQRIAKIKEEKRQIETNSSRYARSYDIIYGHFSSDKYDSVSRNAKKAIFFRDPVERVCSDYFYRLKKQTPGSDGDLSKVSIVEFCSRDNLKDLYRNYLGPLSPSSFDFVGITEHFEESLQLFEKVFGIKIPALRERVGEVKNYRDLLDDRNILQEVKASEYQNRKIYEDGLRAFEKLLDRFHV